MDGRFRARELRESKGYAGQLKQIQPDVRRIDEQLWGITWALSHRPEVFPKVGNTKLHRVLTDPWPDAPRLRIWFTYDDNYVDLLWIEKAEELNKGTKDE